MYIRNSTFIQYRNAQGGNKTLSQLNSDYERKWREREKRDLNTFTMA